MNQAVTSKDAILAECRQMVREKGLSSINMRTVAKACDVAVGSIYNYFPSKSDLMAATVESVWKDIFHMTEEPLHFDSFTECLSLFFERIRASGMKYPGFFNLHSVSFASDERSKGRQMMETYFGHLKRTLTIILEKDPLVRTDAFNAILTPAIFTDYIFTVFLAILLEQKEDCTALIELAEHSIYKIV